MKPAIKPVEFAKILNFRHFGIGLTLAFAIVLGLRQESLLETIREALDFTTKVCLISQAFQKQEKDSQDGVNKKQEKDSQAFVNEKENG